MRARSNTSRLRQTVHRVCWLFLSWLLLLFADFAAPAAPVYSITDFVTCRNANTNAPNDWHLPQAVFNTNTDRFFAWVELRNVSGRHTVEMKLYRPDGTYYGRETQPIHETNRTADWWRMVAWWRIKGEELAQAPGIWELDLLIDGGLQKSIALKISPGPNAAGQPVLSNLSPVSKRCIILASSDLLHWTPIQTNAFPASAVSDVTSAMGGIRVKLRGPDDRSCIVEVSPDSADWTAIQTNDLPGQFPLDSCFYRAVIR